MSGAAKRSPATSTVATRLMSATQGVRWSSTRGITRKTGGKTTSYAQTMHRPKVKEAMQMGSSPISVYVHTYSPQPSPYTRFHTESMVRRGTPCTKSVVPPSTYPLLVYTTWPCFVPWSQSRMRLRHCLDVQQMRTRCHSM